VEDYVRRVAKETGESFGSTRLARAMREPHRVEGNDRANDILEGMLTRQDIEAWLKRGVEFSELKFRFVDYFVQELIREDGDRYREWLHDARVEKVTRAVHDLMYEEWTPKEEPGDYADPVPGLIYKTADDNIARLTIKFISSMNGVYYCRVVLLSGTGAPGVDWNTENASVYTGYFAGSASFHVSESEDFEHRGTLFIQDVLVFHSMARASANDNQSLLKMTFANTKMKIDTHDTGLGGLAGLKRAAPMSTDDGIWLEVVDDSGLDQLFENLKFGTL